MACSIFFSYIISEIWQLDDIKVGPELLHVCELEEKVGTSYITIVLRFYEILDCRIEHTVRSLAQ